MSQGLPPIWAICQKSAIGLGQNPGDLGARTFLSMRKEGVNILLLFTDEALARQFVGTQRSAVPMRFEAETALRMIRDSTAKGITHVCLDYIDGQEWTAVTIEHFLECNP